MISDADEEIKSSAPKRKKRKIAPWSLKDELAIPVGSIVSQDATSSKPGAVDVSKIILPSYQERETDQAPSFVFKLLKASDGTLALGVVPYAVTRAIETSGLSSDDEKEKEQLQGEEKEEEEEEEEEEQNEKTSCTGDGDGDGEGGSGGGRSSANKEGDLGEDGDGNDNASKNTQANDSSKSKRKSKKAKKGNEDTQAARKLFITGFKIKF
jgi:hypothetical protein